MEKPTFEELMDRISGHMAHGGFTDLDAACWEGYIMALLEWGLISVAEHQKLCKLLPPLDPPPSVKIALGYSSQREQDNPQD